MGTAKQRRLDQLQARKGFESSWNVTPSDGVDQPSTSEELYVGGTGNITYTPADGGTDVLISAVPVGAQLRIRTRRIKATGTTATLIVAFA